jgi:prepilin-type N-terminal cleavage/methylation domain-containing protein
MTGNLCKNQRSAQGGFSLAEVVLCLAILPVALSGLFFLLGICLAQSRETVQTTEAVQLADMVLSALRSDPFDACPLFAGKEIAAVALGGRTPDDPPIELHAWTRTPPPPLEGVAENAATLSALPFILRTRGNPPDADYRILIRFEPHGRGGPSPSNSCRGTLAGIQIVLGASGGTVFQSSQFIPRSQPPVPVP